MIRKIGLRQARSLHGTKVIVVEDGQRGDGKRRRGIVTGFPSNSEYKTKAGNRSINEIGAEPAFYVGNTLPEVLQFLDGEIEAVSEAA